jgi:hypothetical protein
MPERMNPPHDLSCVYNLDPLTEVVVVVVEIAIAIGLAIAFVVVPIMNE